MRAAKHEAKAAPTRGSVVRKPATAGGRRRPAVSSGLRAGRPALLLVSVLLGGLASCNAVLGIEERAFDPSLAGDQDGGTLSCETYCEVVLAACTDDLAVYASLDTCLETCKLLPLGTADDTNVNTIGCRLRLAQAAAKTNEKEDYCPYAGPGGGGRCGTNCEGYCAVMLPVCPETFDSAEACAAACEHVPDQGVYSVLVPNVNTIQCRLYHLTSSTVDPVGHCSHAAGELKCCDHPAGGDDIQCVANGAHE